jgi:YVTN family beta-propeller protein
VGVFDATSGKLMQTVKAGKNPDAIVYEPLTHRVFVFNGGSSDVTAIDARSLKVLATSIPALGKPEFAVVDGHGRVYFNIEDKSELSVLYARTLQVQRHYGLGPCEEPTGLAIDPKGRLYSVCRNSVMVVSDPVLGRVIGQATIPSAQGARTIAADPNEHVLLLPTADKSTRPEAIPGTSRVLVPSAVGDH